MRILLLLFFSINFIALSFAQTGPGGVGNSINIEAWMDASRLSLSNNDPVSSWTDFSGNNNNADQSISINQPSFLSNQLNSLPVIEFDGANDYLDFTSAIAASGVTVFTITNPTTSSYKSILATNNHHISYGSGTIRAEFPSGKKSISKAQTFSISSMSTSSEVVSSTPVFLSNNSLTSTSSRTGFYSIANNSIGSLLFNGNLSFFFQGQMAEIIVFNEQLNSAKRKIVSNHLAGKYNLTAEQNLYTHKATHGHEVIGVGQESDGSHTLSKGNDSLEISNASSLGNGDYILVGNDDGGYATSSSVGVGADQRWTQVWRADLTGTPGNIDLTFFLGANDFANDPNDYVVLIERLDGDFSNGGTIQEESGRVYDAVNKTVTFTGISLLDGDYFTLAEKSGITPPTPQTINFGPGGVGNTANIVAWMDASRLSLINNDPVNSWTDLSGNNNDANQSTAINQPTFLSSQLNSLPVIEFDGTNDYLDFTSAITASGVTVFAITNPTTSTYKSILATNNHHISYGSGTIRAEFPSGKKSISKAQTFSISSMSTSSEVVSSTPVFLSNNSLTSTSSRTGFYSIANNSIGSLLFNGNLSFFFQGQMAEIIVFNEQLNSAKRKIVSNHLAAKYNLTAEENLYAHKTTYGHEVIGLGQEADGNHTEARGRDSLLVNNPSSLGNGDYILIGSDNADFTTTSTGAIGTTEQWNRTWRADVTGSPGTIDVTFYLGSNGFAGVADYIVLIESLDGDFSNGGTRIHATGRSFNASDLSVSFTGLNLLDGDYFTLAEVAADVVSISNGNWDNTSTWNCACIPTQADAVTINHNVSITKNESVFDLEIAAGSLSFASNDSLSIFGDFTNSIVNHPALVGTIVISNALDTQRFNGAGSASIEMNNLFMQGKALLIETGEWSILNNIQVSNGTITSEAASDVILASSSSKTSQILPSVSNAFIGKFTVQRYISARNSNYSNMASPISDATAADLDGELTLSGIGGADGNAQATGGGIYRSMHFFDSPTDLHVAITSTSTALPSGVGFEVFLDTVKFFTARTLTYQGTPFSGSLSSTIVADFGWNLIGNPYHSYIDLGSVDKGSISADYYIYNSSTGSYSFFTAASNTPIAPGQGFWIDKSTSGNQFINFDENDKVDNNSSAFLRMKKDPKFKLSLSNSKNNFSHQMALLFDYNATSEIDNLDARYLQSPLEEAPAIYSKASNSDIDLIVNSLSAFNESQLIPVEIYAGIDGVYSIDAENIDKIYDNYSCVYLKDKANNETIDLSVESSYQFETTKGTSERFELILSNSYVECEKLIEDGTYTQKLDHNLALRNAYGQWYLDYTLDENQQQVEIRILNINGQVVRDAISFGASNAGTYRLQNLQDLKGIYLIQVRTKDGFLNQTVKL